MSLRFGFQQKERERKERQRADRKAREREETERYEMEKSVKQRLEGGDLREKCVARVLELMQTPEVEERIRRAGAPRYILPVKRLDHVPTQTQLTS